MPNYGRDKVIAEMSALMTDQERRSTGVDVGLGELVEHALEQVPSAQYAGVTVVHRVDGISTGAATHSYPQVLDDIQEQHRDGPCTWAARQHESVRIDDLSSDGRWPKFQREALQRTPVRSIMSFELLVSEDTSAALNFHADKPHAFDAESWDTGFVVATHVALSWTLLRRGEQFRSALASRDIIGQAKGIIMERFDVDAIRAFALLTKLSQSTNTKLVDVARKLVDTDHPAES